MEKIEYILLPNVAKTYAVLFIVVQFLRLIT